jgi:hypothetical protein
MAPAVEDGGDTDARTEMTTIRGDGEHGLGCHLEQQVVSLRLVVKGDVSDLGGHREDHVEMPTGSRSALRAASHSRAADPGTSGSADSGSCCRRCVGGRSPCNLQKEITLATWAIGTSP